MNGPLSPQRRRRRGDACLLLALALALGSAIPAQARPARLEMRRLELELSGPPVAVLPGDLDGDGRLDLLVVTAYTFWGETSTYTTEMVDGRMWEMVQVVPSLIDRREWQLYLAGSDGSYTAAGPPQDLPPGVLAFSPGPAAHPILVLTDDGLAEVTAAPAEGALVLTTLLPIPPAFAGTGGLLPGYLFTHDVDGDGELDVLLPTARGLQIHLTRGAALVATGPPLALPGDATGRDGVSWRSYPLPHLQDVDGDGVRDLVVFHKAGHRPLVDFENHRGLGAISVLHGRGEGQFGPPVRVQSAARAAPEHLPALEALLALIGDNEMEGTLAAFDDFDGDGRVELATYRDLEPGDAGFRQEMKHAKRPEHEYKVYRVDADLVVAAEPYMTFKAQGYPFTFNWLEDASGGFTDLDGDGRLELVTVDLDFSLWQVPKILIAKNIGLGLDFHVWTQTAAGSFREVKASRVRGKLKLNLRQVKLTEFAQFAGDYDGDGNTDFVHLGGGRKVEIHRGQDGAVYPTKPDLTLVLDRSPDDTGLIKAPDLNGDGQSDLLVVTLLKPDEAGETRPTRVEIYLSGAGS